MEIKIKPQIFKAYDIRGIYPTFLDEKTAYFVGKAFVKFLKKKKPKIVIGRDNRLSSDSLFKALSLGVVEEGGDVFDIGLSTTPMLYFALAYFKFDGGINITASHNPKEYNGFKLAKKNALPVKGKELLKIVEKLSAQKDLKKKENKGKIFKKEVLNEYLDFNLKDFDLKKFLPFKIAIDSGNAVAGILVEKLSQKTPFKIFHLFKKLDGSFPNHPPDPLVEKNLKFLKQEIKKRNANLGVAFDGDGDRIVFLDEKGKVIFGDLILALISKYLLKENPGKKILYDLRCSKVVKETILENGGKPIESRVGHSFIKEKMRKEKIFFGGEFSGHFYHQKHYFCEVPLFVFLKLLEILSKEKKPLSKLILPFKKYFHSGEINFKIKEKEALMEKLEKKYKRGKKSHLDGLKIEFKDWWFLVRPSQTEPLLRLIIEAKSKALLKEKKKEIISLIKSFSRKDKI